MDKSDWIDRLKQMRDRDVPWHFRAASTQGSKALNLNKEIDACAEMKPIESNRDNRIKRRCETDAIEFGAYISLRWLLEFCEILFNKPDKDGVSKLRKKDSRNASLTDYSPNFTMSESRIESLQTKFQIASLSDEYSALCQFTAHPAIEFRRPIIKEETIDRLLALIEHLLSEEVYRGEEFRKRWYRLKEEDPAADTPPLGRTDSPQL